MSEREEDSVPVEVGRVVDDLFRRESAHLVAALIRVLGPTRIALAEDVVQDALASAMHAWRFGPPDDPKAWILLVARRRAIDILRRERRFPSVAEDEGVDRAVDDALAPETDGKNQLAMMLAICDDALSAETHVTLILRFLCGLSPSEIARAFLCDVQTIDRRLHRGRAHLATLRSLPGSGGDERSLDGRLSADEVRRRQPSIEKALYLLFNEGYHGSDADNPLHPAMCADAIRLAELLLASPALTSDEASAYGLHAMTALFCLHAARLATRLDDEGVFVPLAEQDRTRWNRSLLERGLVHLGESAGGDRMTRWHLEAGIAFEHASAASVADTRWDVVVRLYDALMALSPGPVVALNRGLAIAELHGLDAGRAELAALATDAKLEGYSFYWAARADIERRAARPREAAELYRRAMAAARSGAERGAYERRLRALVS